MSEIAYLSNYGPMTERAGFESHNDSFAVSARTRIVDRLDGTVGVALYAPGLMRAMTPDTARAVADALVDAAEAAEADEVSAALPAFGVHADA